MAALLASLEDQPPLLVDITGGREPWVVRGLEEGLRAVVEEVLASREEVVEVGVEGRDVTCVCGLLLGFPILYTSTTEAHSLAGRDLVVVALEATSMDITSTTVSFSLPAALREEGVVAGRLAAWWKGVGGGVAWGREVAVARGELTLGVVETRVNMDVVTL